MSNGMTNGRSETAAGRLPKPHRGCGVSPRAHSRGEPASLRLGPCSTEERCATLAEQQARARGAPQSVASSSRSTRHVAAIEDRIITVGERTVISWPTGSDRSLAVDERRRIAERHASEHMLLFDESTVIDRPGTSNGPTEAINGRLEHLRGSALGFRNLTNYIARSLLETGGFRPHLHPRM
jgi:hypothetical protein